MAGSGAAADITIHLAAGAEADLQGIWRRRLLQRGAACQDGADALLDTLIACIEGLADNPERGPVPPELETLGIRTYRQLSHPPFRIVYRFKRQDGSGVVIVMLAADARRDFRTLLEERLLAGR